MKQIEFRNRMDLQMSLESGKWILVLYDFNGYGYIICKMDNKKG